jgi:hypothetical protein
LFPEDLKEHEMNLEAKMKHEGMFRSNPGGFQIVFENGYEVSVQFTKGHYCNNRGDQNNHPMTCGITHTCNNAEVAVFDPNGQIVALESENQRELGWQSPAQVLDLMNKVANK